MRIGMSAKGQKQTHVLQQTSAYSMTSLARALPLFKPPFRACAGVGLSSMSPVAICTTWTALRNYAFPQVELSNV